MTNLGQQSEIKRYLLGEPDKELIQRVEERFMADGKYRDEVLIVESEMLEGYLTGTLSPDEQERFTSHYLSTSRNRKKLKEMRVLLKAAQASPLPVPKIGLLERLRSVFWFSTPRQKFAFGSVIALVVIGGLVLLQAWRLRNQQTELQAELTRLNTPESISTVNNSVVQLTLLPVSLREQDALPRITLTPETQLVQLRTPVGGDAHELFRVELRNVRNELLADFETKAQPSNGVLILQLPARILERDDYSVVIKGVTANGEVRDLGTYSFRVIKQ